MERYQRHRYALALPFLLFGVIALLGGLVNGATASGRIVDDYTGDPVKEAALSVGRRMTWSDADGSYRLENVPRTTSIRVDVGGYFRTSAPPDAGDIRLGPNSITAQVNVEGADPVVGVPAAQFRQELRVLATANTTGGASIVPHPGRDAKMTVCAAGYKTKEVTVRGVTLVVLLAKDPTGACPPLPTPTPNPNATPTPPPPAATPGASPSPSPSPR